MPNNITPELFVKEIQDIYIRKNFQNLFDYFNNQNQLLDFKFIEVEFEEAGTKLIAHGLNKIPKDIIRCSLIGSGVVTFNKSSFTNTVISLTASAAVKARFFVGTYFQDPAGFDTEGPEEWSTGATDGVDGRDGVDGTDGSDGADGTGGDSTENVVEIDSDYTVGSTDSYILVDPTAAVTVTLPNASDFLGRQITFQKKDSTFIQHTISTVAGQLINNVAAKTTFLLSTLNEIVTLVSDGTVWLVKNHTYPSQDISYTPTFTAMGTVSSIVAYYRREGDSLSVRCHSTAGTVTGSEARVSFPSTLLTANSAKLKTGTNLVGEGKKNQGAAGVLKNHSVLVEPSVSYFTFSVSEQNEGINPFTKQNGNVILGNNEAWGFIAKCPINGWES